MIVILLLALLAVFGLNVGSPDVDIGGGSAPPPTETLVEPVVPPLERVDVRRTGGIAYQELEATITDPDTLAGLSELLPNPLPTAQGAPSGCADCWEYRIVLDFVGAEEAVVLEFDQANVPAGLQAFVEALDGQLE